MTDKDSTGSTPPEEEPPLSRRQQQDTLQPADDPGYLTRTGEAVGEDGSVVPIIGGLPAVEGSAWDIGAPLEDRGTGLDYEQGSSPGHVSDEDTRLIRSASRLRRPHRSGDGISSRSQRTSQLSLLIRLGGGHAGGEHLMPVAESVLY